MADDLARENELASLYGGRAYRFLTPETLRERFNRLEQAAQDALRRKLDKANALQPGRGHRISPQERQTHARCMTCGRNTRLRVGRSKLRHQCTTCDP